MKLLKRLGGVILCLSAGLIFTLLTVRIPVYTEVRHAELGISTFTGLPFPYRECAPGLAWCRFSPLFFVDVLVFSCVSWGIYRIFRRGIVT